MYQQQIISWSIMIHLKNTHTHIHAVKRPFSR